MWYALYIWSSTVVEKVKEYRMTRAPEPGEGKDAEGEEPEVIQDQVGYRKDARSQPSDFRCTAAAQPVLLAHSCCGVESWTEKEIDAVGLIRKHELLQVKDNEWQCSLKIAWFTGPDPQAHSTWGADQSQHCTLNSALEKKEERNTHTHTHEHTHTQSKITQVGTLQEMTLFHWHIRQCIVSGCWIGMPNAHSTPFFIFEILFYVSLIICICTAWYLMC